MRWHCIFFKLSLFVVLALVLASPASARGNTTSGIYPGTVKDVCVHDIVFVGETGLNLTPLTPNANGVVQELRKYINDQPDPYAAGYGGPLSSINVGLSNNNFDVPPVGYYGTYFPVVDGQVLRDYAIQIQPYWPQYPTNVVITSSKDWVIADGSDSALLTITVTDLGNNPVSGANLVLGASPPWRLRDTVLKTDGSGKAQTLFLPTTKSGAAVIAAGASYPGASFVAVTNTQVQNIDAGTPFYWYPLYPSTATVGSPVKIFVFVRDRNLNPVTSTRTVKNVSFVASATGIGGFPDGLGNRSKAISVPLNEMGVAEVTYQMSTEQGDNFVSIIPPAPLGSGFANILGIGDSRPFSISQSVNPAGNPPFILTDGSQATIDYYLLDQWGNPSTDQGIQIVTSVGESRIFYTNEEGRATILYGPKLTAGFYGITATAVANFSVSISQTLQFGSLDPDNMLLTASPQTMASLDVNPSMVGHVIAKVIDKRGNPVKGQTVTFWIGKSDSRPYNRTKDPAIGSGGVTTSNISAPIPVITDENGQAILDYYPGEFPLRGNLGWSAIAQGMTTVNASWTNSLTGTVKNIPIDLSYKNYPFLSVYTEVNPKTIQTGGQVDVSVRLKGDGWALQPKPIDVVLCTDRSATMLYNESIISGRLAEESLNDRMVDAMNAAIAFVHQTSGQDRVGLVTFGDPAGGLALLNKTFDTARDKYVSPYYWRAGRDYDCKVDKKCEDPGNRDITNKMPYILASYPGHGTTGKDYRVNGVLTGAYVESPLTFDKGQIAKAINSTVPAGGTPMRRAIYESVKQIINDPEQREGAVKAIILLTDGKYNLDGDPQGIVHDIWGPASYTELEKDLGGDGTGSVIAWAKMKNIKIFTVALVGSDSNDQPDKQKLQEYADETGGKPYVANSGADLTGIYIDIAGQLREEASVDTQVELNFANVEVNGTEKFPGDAVLKYEFIRENNRSTFIVPPVGSPVVVDNTTDWESGGRQFKFSAGTIKINQVWMINFTLTALKEGNIKILDSKTSKVTFTGVVGEVGIPDTYITAVPPGTEKGPEDIDFHIERLRRTGDVSNTQIASLAWDVIYTGSDNLIDWTIYIAPPYSTAFGQVEFLPDVPRGWDPIYPLILKDLKPGTYTVKVRGHVNDAADAEKTLPITIPEPTATPQILIQ
ncbi:MAG: VWA domain-containing protein [Methanomicrobiales archaeon]|nr:VWA domain-containing protein [Methanomicrobiales archaeon]